MSAALAKRRIVDVNLRDIYLVRIAGRDVAVKLLAREGSGVWLGRNSETGADLYVTFGDLGAKVSDSQRPPPAVDSQVAPLPLAMDFRRLAAGEREDEQ